MLVENDHKFCTVVMHLGQRPAQREAHASAPAAVPTRFQPCHETCSVRITTAVANESAWPQAQMGEACQLVQGLSFTADGSTPLTISVSHGMAHHQVLQLRQTRQRPQALSVKAVVTGLQTGQVDQT